MFAFSFLFFCCCCVVLACFFFGFLLRGSRRLDVSLSVSPHRLTPRDSRPPSPVPSKTPPPPQKKTKTTQRSGWTTRSRRAWSRAWAASFRRACRRSRALSRRVRWGVRFFGRGGGNRCRGTREQKGRAASGGGASGACFPSPSLFLVASCRARTPKPTPALSPKHHLGSNRQTARSTRATAVSPAAVLRLPGVFFPRRRREKSPPLAGKTNDAKTNHPPPPLANPFQTKNHRRPPDRLVRARHRHQHRHHRPLGQGRLQRRRVRELS